MSRLDVNTLRHTAGSADNITLDNSQNATVEGNLTVDGTTTLTGAVELPDDTVDIADLSATGTASSSTFLRGDNAWAAAGGGKLLQVVGASTSTNVSMTDTTWTDTGLTVTINNVASGSSVLVLVDQQISARKDATGKSFGLRLLRGSTVIQAPLSNSSGLPWENYIDIPNNGATRTGFSGRHSIIKLDASPGTGSVVYHVEMNNYASGSSSTLEAQRQDTTDSTSNITVLEIGA